MGEPITEKHLNNYLGWKMRVDSDMEQLVRANSQMIYTAPQGGDGSQSGGYTGDKVGAKLIRRMDIEEALLPCIHANREKMTQVEDAVLGLEDPLQQAVLKIKYLDGIVDEEGLYHYERPQWAEVAWKMYRKDDESTIKRVKRLYWKALDEISKVEFRT